MSLHFAHDRTDRMGAGGGWGLRAISASSVSRRSAGLTIEQEVQVERLQEEQKSRGVPLPPVFPQVLM